MWLSWEVHSNAQCAVLRIATVPAAGLAGCHRQGIRAEAHLAGPALPPLRPPGRHTAARWYAAGPSRAQSGPPGHPAAAGWGRGDWRRNGEEEEGVEEGAEMVQRKVEEKVQRKE